MEDRKFGKYEVRATLGRGAMGTVYEAWDPAIERKVAIKTVNLPTGDDVEAKDCSIVSGARRRRRVV